MPHPPHHRVRVLTDTGFTGRFGNFMVHLAGGSVWGQSLAFGFVSALLVNVQNDLPSTVCWASMLPILCESYAPRHFHVVLQALLVGINPGTYLSIVSGVVWWSPLCLDDWACWGRDGDAIHSFMTFTTRNMQRTPTAWGPRGANVDKYHQEPAQFQAVGVSDSRRLELLRSARARACYDCYLCVQCPSVLYVPCLSQEHTWTAGVRQMFVK